MRSALTFSAAILLAMVGSTHATQIDPGFDLFESLPGTEVDLSTFGLGIVPLEGVPFGPGNTDTIVQRIQGIGPPFDPPSDTGLIDIELVALQLRSVAPVDLTPFGGPFVGVFSDFYTTINKGGIIPGIPQPDPVNPSIGQMEIRHTLPGGGTFDSCFGNAGDGGVCAALGVPGGGVYADGIFTIPGGDPSNPGDVLLTQPAPRVSLWSQDSTWSHTAPPNDPRNFEVETFPAGDFYVGDIEHTGPHPVDPATTSVNVQDISVIATDGPVIAADFFIPATVGHFSLPTLDLIEDFGPGGVGGKPDEIAWWDLEIVVTRDPLDVGDVVVAIDKDVTNLTDLQWHDFRMTLGTGLGPGFVESSETDGLYFNLLPAPIEETGAFANPPMQDEAIDPDDLRWVVAGAPLPPGATANWWLSITVPDSFFDPFTGQAVFTLREHASVPEPGCC